MKAIFDAVDVKKATEEEISRYTALCDEDLLNINTPEERKTDLFSLVRKLQNRNK